MKIYRLVVLIILLVSFFACRQSPQVANENSNTGDTTLISVDPEASLNEIFHRFPSPDEMLLVFEKEKFVFNPSLLSNPSKASTYLDSKSQALNLGIYIADFAYLSAFKRFNESPAYFESIYKLCDNLQISSAFDKTVVNRIENNLSNPDSLKNMYDIAYSNMNNYLVSNKNEKIFALISIGGFIEALYLSFGISSSQPDNLSLKQHIVDQKFVLENIVAYSEQFKNKEDVQATLEILNPIIEVYKELQIIPEQTKITKNKIGKLTISGGDRLEITNEQFEELRKTTTEARKRIIKN